MPSLGVEAIWTEYGDRLRNFLRGKLANSQDVEDVLQEVLIKTHKKLHTLRDSDKLAPWLFQIARHAAIDHYRQEKPSSSINVEFLEDQTQENPDDVADFSACILPLVNALPPESGELLRRIDLEGQSQKNYAHEHGIPYTTLKSRLQKARAALRSQARRCCELTLDTSGQVLDFQAKPNACRTCPPDPTKT